MTASGFWGLLIEPGKMYSQEVPASFKVTMASLGPEAEESVEGASKSPSCGAGSTDTPSQAKTGRTTVMLRMEEQDDYAICSLTPGKLEQQPLDLVLKTRERIAFRVCGPYPIHLTGYYVNNAADEDVDMDDFINDDESEAEEVDGEYDSEDESQYDSEEAERTVEKIMKKKRKRMAIVPSSDEEVDTEGESTGSHSEECCPEEEEDEDEYDSEDDDFIDDDEDGEDMSEGDFSDTDSYVSEESEDEEIVPQGKRSNSSEAPLSKKVQSPESNKSRAVEKKADVKKNMVCPNKAEPKKEIVQQQQNKETIQQGKPNNSQQQKHANNVNRDVPKEIVAEGKDKLGSSSSINSTPNNKDKPNNNDNNKNKENTPNKQQQSIPGGSAKKPVCKTLPSGLKIEDVVVGAGPEVAKGKRVGISYVGRLESGEVFDSTSRNNLFYFNVGRNEVVKGMDIGIERMRVGGRRILTIPASLGYGSKRVDKIPPNSTLIFELTAEKLGGKN